MRPVSQRFQAEAGREARLNHKFQRLLHPCVHRLHLAGMISYVSATAAPTAHFSPGFRFAARITAKRRVRPFTTWRASSRVSVRVEKDWNSATVLSRRPGGSMKLWGQAQPRGRVSARPRFISLCSYGTSETQGVVEPRHDLVRCRRTVARHTFTLRRDRARVSDLRRRLCRASLAAR